MLSRVRFVVILLLLGLSPQVVRAQGCLCASAPGVQESFDDAVLVFAGVVEKIDDPEGERIRALPAADQDAARTAAEQAGKAYRTVTFRVLQWWKGDASQKRVHIQTELAGTPCGFSVEDGHSYLVFSGRSWRDPNRLVLSSCNQTAPLVCSRAAMAQLGKPLASFEAIDQARLIAREQPFNTLGRECMTIPLLINDRPALQEGCYYDVEGIIDESGVVRAFKDRTDYAKSSCPALDPKIIEAWRFKPATIDGTPVQVRLQRINRTEPFTVADQERWRAADEARRRAKKKP